MVTDRYPSSVLRLITGKDPMLTKGFRGTARRVKGQID